LIAACILAASLFLSYRAVRAEFHFTQVQLWVSTDALQAFGAANEAYKSLPLDGRYRMQLLLSLESLAASRDNVMIAPDAADKAYRYAASASPRHPAVLIARAQYLLNSGRWRENAELAGIVRLLETTARSHPQTWTIAAHYYARANQIAKATRAMIEGLERGVPLVEMQALARTMNLEITPQ